MIADRLGPVPDVRRANPAVSPAVASIVRHCLEPDPARRYSIGPRAPGGPPAPARRPAAEARPRALAPRAARQVGPAAPAADLVDDRRARRGLPARGRHGRLPGPPAPPRSGWRRRTRSAGSPTRCARPTSCWARATPTPRQIEEGIALCRDALGRYRRPRRPGLGRRRPLVALLPGSRTATGSARTSASSCSSGPGPSPGRPRRRPTRRGEPDLAGIRPPVERRWRRSATAAGPSRAPGGSSGPTWRGSPAARTRPAGSASRPRPSRSRTPMDRLWLISDRLDRVPAPRTSSPSSGRSPRSTPRTSRTGSCSATAMRSSARCPASSHLDEAEHCYGIGIALRPDLLLGLLQPRPAPPRPQGLSAQALADFDRVIALRPDLATAYINRALARLGLGDFRGPSTT